MLDCNPQVDPVLRMATQPCPISLIHASNGIRIKNLSKFPFMRIKLNLIIKIDIVLNRDQRYLPESG